jgi:hypothetical protein
MKMSFLKKVKDKIEGKTADVTKKGVEVRKDVGEKGVDKVKDAVKKKEE